MTSSTKPLYAGHRFPPELISYTVWRYFRFPLSFRMVEEMLAFRGIEVSHETIRQWALGPKGNAADTVFSVKPFTASRSEEGCHRARSGQGQGAPPARGPAALLDRSCARRPAGRQIGTTG
jgi:hypothetical protein